MKELELVEVVDFPKEARVRLPQQATALSALRPLSSPVDARWGLG